MKLKRILLVNFKSFSGEHSFTLPTNPGLYLVAGDNGAGKSSLFVDAVVWCLYGKSSRGLKGPKVATWEGKDTTRVTLQLSLDGEKDLWICRDHNPNFLGYTATLEDTLIKIEQRELEGMIGISYEGFLASVVFDQSGAKFLDLAPALRLKLLSSVLDLDSWDEYIERAKSKVKDIGGAVEALRRDEVSKQTAIDLLEREIKQAKLSSQQWEAEGMADLSKEIETRQSELVVLDKERGELLAEADKITRDMEEVSDQRLKLEDEHQVLSKAFRSVDARLHDAGAAVEELQADIKGIEDYTEKRCPTCGQVIGTEVANALKDSTLKEITYLENMLDVHLDEAEGLSVCMKDLSQRTGTCEVTLASLRGKERKVQGDIAARELQIEGLTGELAGLEQEVKDRGDPFTHETNPFSEQIARLSGDLEFEKVRLQTVQGYVTAMERFLRIHQFWVNNFKVFKLAILDKNILYLENRVNAVLGMLGLPTWQMKFGVIRETASGNTRNEIVVDIFSPNNRDPVRYESWSGGETQRLRLAVAMAISELVHDGAGHEHSFEVFDEPSSWLSEQGINELLQTLKDRAQDFGLMTFIIDHRQLEFGFTGSINVVKNDSGSSIIE